MVDDSPDPSTLELPTTERLVLRRFGPEDLSALVAYRRQPEVARYQSWSPSWSMTDAEALLRADQTVAVGTRGRWTQIALQQREAGTICGDVALHFLADQPDTVELGVTLDPRAQGQGLASEALRAVIDWLFTAHGTHRVLAQADARNAPVRRLFERLGLRQEAELRDADWFKGEWTTLCIYAQLDHEWRAAQTR